MAASLNDSRSGLTYGVAAYLTWGIIPIYWPLLDPASPYEVLAHRITWTTVLCVGLVAVTRKWRQLLAIVRNPRMIRVLAVASILISYNWGLYIWAIINNHVIETSLGYFINPLVTVLVGVIVLGENLRRWQWVAVGLGAVAVLVLAVDNGRPPWIALTLAMSFAAYGFLKKQAQLGTIEALTVETSIVVPFSLGYLVFLGTTGALAFGGAGVGHTLLLMSTGIVTALPLLLFGAAATRLSLTTIGLLQYTAPIMQFILGLTYFGETMSTARWIGFVLVWCGLVVFTIDGVTARRRARSEIVADTTAL